jgi:Xaa-Pro aminopeptidase
MTSRPAILPLRDRASLRDSWLLERLDTIVPMLMERAGIDAWVLAAREYNEDPVVETMLPAHWLSARRRTVLLLLDKGQRRMAVTRYAAGEGFAAAWDPEAQPDQWARVAELLVEAAPETIAVNRSSTFALADGMSASEYQALSDALPTGLHQGLVSGEPLAVGWLETRIPAEVDAYREACQIAHGLLRRGLSGEAITPGRTTTAELEWWYRQQVHDLGLRSWFHPTVSVQRAGGLARSSFAGHPPPMTIERGDLVHVDFGIDYLGLHTDMQEKAYIGLPGETGPPPGLTAGFEAGKRLQDLIMNEFAVGRTGNAILAAARSRAIDEGLTPSVYSHPIGLHGHAAGPTIGLWDQQSGVPEAGDYPVHPDTAYSIECNVRCDVDEWGGQEVAFMLEEDAFFNGERIEFIDGRQDALWFLDGGS